MLKCTCDIVSRVKIKGDSSHFTGDEMPEVGYSI